MSAVLAGKKCKGCGQRFVPERTFQVACSIRCAQDFAAKARSKENKKAARVARDRLKTRSEWLAEAQKAFNAWVRERDYGQGCISKDMAVKGFDKEQTLAAMKQEELNFEDQVKEAMIAIMEEGNPDDVDTMGRPKTDVIGKRVDKPEDWPWSSAREYECE